jgi:iron complex outermembrane receptor protein
VQYLRDTSFGSVDFTVAGNYLLKRDIASDGLNFIDGLLTEPKFRGSISAGANIGDFRISGTVLHTAGKGLNANTTGQTRVKAYDTVNAFMSYRFKEDGILTDTVLTFNVTNIFDVLPPVNLTASTGYDPGDLIGRSFQIGLSKKF